MTKKLSLFVFLIALIVFFAPKEAFYKALVYFNITKQCYKSNNIFLEIFEQEGFDYKKENQAMVEDGLTKLDNNNLEDRLSIPKISHHIYFTGDKKPKALNAFFVEKMKASFNKLNQVEKGWKHYIWTNKPEIIPSGVAHIPGVEIKSIEEFKGHELYQYLSDSIIKGGDLKPYFSEGSDLLRFMAVEKFGGMYNDMDYEIYNPQGLIRQLHKFDFIGGREITKALGYYGSAFIAAKPNHPILKEAVRRSLRNNELKGEVPDYIKYPCSEFDRIYFNAPPLLTLSYFTSNNIEGNRDIILPTWMIFNATFARYKNIDCNYDLVTKELFNNREHNLQSLLAAYPINTKEEGVPDSNIYFSIRDRRNFDIIGADMFCGGWSSDSKSIKKRKYYWVWD
jgi:hypothetical protein